MIKARRVTFDWATTPLHWVPDDAFTTHVINVLHLLLPAGEKWFCDVFRQALPLVGDGPLREEAKGFIGQEAVHARAHSLVLDHLAAQGLDTAAYTARVDWMFERLLGDHGLGEGHGPRWLRRLWLVARSGHGRGHRALHLRAGVLGPFPVGRLGPVRAPIPPCWTCCAGTGPRRSSTARSPSTCTSASAAATSAGWS